MNHENFDDLLNRAKALPPSIGPARDLWPGIAAELRAASVAAAPPRRNSAVVFLCQPALMAAVLTILCAVSYWTWLERGERASWAVATLSGAPRVGAAPIPAEARLRAGQWLETDANSTARIAVGSIGQVSIDENSRVRLISTKAADHRLLLEKGTLHAIISAPPRLFFVETPAATAVDLGCMYDLSVDDTGRGTLTVTLGYVALAHGTRETVVRAGMKCDTRPGVAPGTPYSMSATPTLRAALTRFDFETAAALPEVIAAATRIEDASTLWFLLARAAAADRAALFDALAPLVPPQGNITRTGILSGDPAMIDSWRALIEAPWTNSKDSKIKVSAPQLP